MFSLLKKTLAFSSIGLTSSYLIGKDQITKYLSKLKTDKVVGCRSFAFRLTIVMNYIFI